MNAAPPAIVRIRRRGPPPRTFMAAPISNRIGRRKLLMIGAAAFGVASVIAAFSTSAEMLIATRAGSAYPRAGPWSTRQ